MNTKQLVVQAMLVAVGAALYLTVPGFSGGMKPDFMLTMMFIGILLFRNPTSVFLLGMTTGILSGLFSTFPSGFIPNVIDKLVTAFVFYAVLVTLRSVSERFVAQAILVALGTLLSGTVFLSVAIFIIGVNVPFLPLVLTVVLPAIALNTVVFVIIYPFVKQLAVRSNLIPSATHS